MTLGRILADSEVEWTPANAFGLHSKEHGSRVVFATYVERDPHGPLNHEAIAKARRWSGQVTSIFKEEVDDVSVAVGASVVQERSGPGLSNLVVNHIVVVVVVIAQGCIISIVEPFMSLLVIVACEVECRSNGKEVAVNGTPPHRFFGIPPEQGGRQDGVAEAITSGQLGKIARAPNIGGNE